MTTMGSNRSNHGRDPRILSSSDFRSSILALPDFKNSHIGSEKRYSKAKDSAWSDKCRVISLVIINTSNTRNHFYFFFYFFFFYFLQGSLLADKFFFPCWVSYGVCNGLSEEYRYRGTAVCGCWRAPRDRSSAVRQRQKRLTYLRVPEFPTWKV